MCTSRNKEVLCLAGFLIYQVALIYMWIIFILTSAYDIEIVYCPRKITGKFFVVYPYNSTNE